MQIHRENTVGSLYILAKHFIVCVWILAAPNKILIHCIA